MCITWLRSYVEVEVSGSESDCTHGYLCVVYLCACGVVLCDRAAGLLKCTSTCVSVDAQKNNNKQLDLLMDAGRDKFLVSSAQTFKITTSTTSTE